MTCSRSKCFNLMRAGNNSTLPVNERMLMPRLSASEPLPALCLQTLQRFFNPPEFCNGTPSPRTNVLLCFNSEFTPIQRLVLLYCGGWLRRPDYLELLFLPGLMRALVSHAQGHGKQKHLSGCFCSVALPIALSLQQKQPHIHPVLNNRGRAA